MSHNDINRAEACERIYTCMFVLVLIANACGAFGA